MFDRSAKLNRALWSGSAPVSPRCNQCRRQDLPMARKRGSFLSGRDLHTARESRNAPPYNIRHCRFCIRTERTLATVGQFSGSVRWRRCWRSHATSRWPRDGRRLHHAFGDDGRALRRIEPVQLRPSRSRTVTTASDLPTTSTEIAEKYSPRPLTAPTIRSVLFARSTANGVPACSTAPPWYRLTPAQAQNGMAHSPIDEVKKAIRIEIPQV
jgi:hypothetical protein